MAARGGYVWYATRALTALPLSSSYPAVGDVIDGKYRVVLYLGEGGMGAVAKAEHLLRRVPVALKFMAPRAMHMEGGVERFLNEAVLASQIRNEHVVGIFDVGKLASGEPYLVMEYLDGRDLADVLRDAGHGEIEPARAVHFILQILRALQEAHAMGIVHRDLKPANCFIVEKDGEQDFVTLLDFGISKAPVSAGLTHTNSSLGTPLYMSPEQARSPKDVDARADLYCAGVILYELLAGRTPHVSESGAATELLLKLFTQEPMPLASLRPDLPAGLCAAVHKSLARERDDRFPNALAMAEALAPYADARSARTLQKLRAFVPSREVTPGIAVIDAFSQLAGESQPLADKRVPAQSDAPPPFDAHAVEAFAATQSTENVSAEAGDVVPDGGPSTAAPGGQRPALVLLVALLVGAVALAGTAAYKIAFAPAATGQPVPMPPPSMSVVVVSAPLPTHEPPPPKSEPIPTRPSPPPPSNSASHAPPPATTPPDLGSLRPHN